MSDLTMLMWIAAAVVLVFGGITVLSNNYTLNGIKSRTVGDGQHGTARWATKKEIQQTYSHIPFQVQKWRHGEDLPTQQSQLKALLDETTALKEKRAFVQEQRGKNAAALLKIESVVAMMEQAPTEITWDESTIRQLVDTVKVISKDKIVVCLRGGVQVEQDMV